MRAYRLILLTVCLSYAASEAAAHEYNRAAVDTPATEIPDRVVLTLTPEPATRMAVTWRTDTSISSAAAEIAIADASPNFSTHAEKFPARTELLENGASTAHFHSVTFSGLKPGTLYAYRVGSGDIWSAWYQFRTAKSGPEPFTFIYFGDAQNNLLAFWSRLVRMAYATAPQADFLLHAGDLVNRANLDSDWAEWYAAGSFIHAQVPSVSTPGNHEYARMDGGPRTLSRMWRPTFTLPENGPTGQEETVYYVDYQDARIISLNSNEQRDIQAAWLETVLAKNPKRWTFVTFHHPVFSSGKGRDNEELRALWKPLFDRYKVDMVLQGHDHTYARGMNLPTGTSARSNASGTMYVVSVSGPKMYTLTSERWMDRGAENTQLFQVIRVDGDRLTYEARTATGELYDAFDLVKQKGKANRLVDRVPRGVPERTHGNTLKRKD